MWGGGGGFEVERIPKSVSTIFYLFYFRFNYFKIKQKKTHSEINPI